MTTPPAVPTPPPEDWWEEWKYRHEFFWASLNRWVLALLAISAVPYISNELVKAFEWYSLVFPAFAVAVGAIAWIHLLTEHARVIYARFKLTNRKDEDAFVKHEPKPGLTRALRWPIRWRIGAYIFAILLWGFIAIPAANVVFSARALPKLLLEFKVTTVAPQWVPTLELGALRIMQVALFVGTVCIAVQLLGGLSVWIRRIWPTRHGVDSSAGEMQGAPLAASVSVTDDQLVIALVDGRTVSVPLAWYPRLLHGTAAERAEWQLTGRGVGIHWPVLDEDIHVRHVLAPGKRASSLWRWFERRRGPAKDQV